jgi:hypothetical protein
MVPQNPVNPFVISRDPVWGGSWVGSSQTLTVTGVKKQEPIIQFSLFNISQLNELIPSFSTRNAFFLLDAETWIRGLYLDTRDSCMRTMS